MESPLISPKRAHWVDPSVRLWKSFALCSSEVAGRDSRCRRGWNGDVLFVALFLCRLWVSAGYCIALATKRLRGPRTAWEFPLIQAVMLLTVAATFALRRLFRQHWQGAGPAMFPLTPPEEAIPLSETGDAYKLVFREEPRVPAAAAMTAMTLIMVVALVMGIERPFTMNVFVFQLFYLPTPWLVMAISCSAAYLCAEATCWWRRGLATLDDAGDGMRRSDDEWEEEAARTYLQMRDAVMALLSRIQPLVSLGALILLSGYTYTLLNLYHRVFVDSKSDPNDGGLEENNVFQFMVWFGFYSTLFTLGSVYLTEADRAGVALRDALVRHPGRPLAHRLRLCSVVERYPIAFRVLWLPVTVTGVARVAGLVVASVIPALVRKVL